MALDTIAAKSAQSLLNGIDYSALIGGPLEAAIKAQAMAAMSTWQFIQQVGLSDKDAQGKRTATTVSFIYQKDGELVQLIVPILTIVPIPLIIIDEVNIEFKANINASASQTTEDSTSETVAAEASAEASVGWGPFSLSAKFQASYSSKKDSKATQDSRYSVEYTQDVRVHASQAGVPAGLATVLNILSNAATGTSINGKLSHSPAVGSLSVDSPDGFQTINIKAVSGDGLNLQNIPVTIAPKDIKYAKALSVSRLPLDQTENWTDVDKKPHLNINTDDTGQIGLRVTLNPEHLDLLPKSVTLTLEAEIDKTLRTKEFPIKIVRPPSGVVITVDPTALEIDSGGTKDAKITVKKNGKPVTGETAKVKIREANEITAKAGQTPVTVDGIDVPITDGIFDLHVSVATGPNKETDNVIAIQFQGAPEAQLQITGTTATP